MINEIKPGSQPYPTGLGQVISGAMLRGISCEDRNHSQRSCEYSRARRTIYCHGMAVMAVTVLTGFVNFSYYSCSSNLLAYQYLLGDLPNIPPKRFFSRFHVLALRAKKVFTTATIRPLSHFENFDLSLAVHAINVGFICCQ